MIPDQDTIVIRAPAGTKARWVHESQSCGSKLSDWVIRLVDNQISKKVSIMTEANKDSTEAPEMSLRDQFALKGLESIPFQTPRRDYTEREVAVMCYRFADAMMAARSLSKDGK